MAYNGFNIDFLSNSLDKIINYAKWAWELERSETGIINSIFTIILFCIIIGTFIKFNEEIYIFILILSAIAFFGFSLRAVSSTEREAVKIKLYYDLKNKYPPNDRIK